MPFKKGDLTEIRRNNTNTITLSTPDYQSFLPSTPWCKFFFRFQFQNCFRQASFAQINPSIFSAKFHFAIIVFTDSNIEA